MVKSRADARVVLSPGLQRGAGARPHVLAVRADADACATPAASTCGATGTACCRSPARHLVWPVSVLARLREFLNARCKGNEHWRGHEALSRRGLHASATAAGAARTRKARCSSTSTSTSRTRRRTCSRCSAPPPTGWSRSLKKESTLVEKNIDALAGLLQLNPAERALLLYGTLARYQRDLRGLLVEFKVVERAGGLCGDRRAWPASTRPRWPRRCAPARGSSASAWSRT